MNTYRYVLPSQRVARWKAISMLVLMLVLTLRCWDFLSYLLDKEANIMSALKAVVGK